MKAYTVMFIGFNGLPGVSMDHFFKIVNFGPLGDHFYVKIPILDALNGHTPMDNIFYKLKNVGDYFETFFTKPYLRKPKL